MKLQIYDSLSLRSTKKGSRNKRYIYDIYQKGWFIGIPLLSPKNFYYADLKIQIAQCDHDIIRILTEEVCKFLPFSKKG